MTFDIDIDISESIEDFFLLGCKSDVLTLFEIVYKDWRAKHTSYAMHIKL